MDSESIETSVLLSVVGIHLEFDDLHGIRRMSLKRSNVISYLFELYKLYSVLYECVSKMWENDQEEIEKNHDCHIVLGCIHCNIFRDT